MQWGTVAFSWELRTQSIQSNNPKKQPRPALNPLGQEELNPAHNHVHELRNNHSSMDLHRNPHTLMLTEGTLSTEPS